MAATFPPGGIGSAPHGARLPVSRAHIALTADEKAALASITAKIERATEKTPGAPALGINCPVCDQLVFLYFYTPSARVMQVLLMLYIEYGTEIEFHAWRDGHRLWADGTAYPSNTHFLIWWGLLEPVRYEPTEMPVAEEKSLTEDEILELEQGRYRISKYGEQFLLGEITIPSHGWWQNGKLLELDDTVELGAAEAMGYRYDITMLRYVVDPTARLRALRSGTPVPRPRHPGRSK